MNRFKKKPLIFLSLIVLSLILIDSTVLLDAFVLTQSYQVVTPSENTPTGTISSEAVITDNSYQDENLAITIETVNENGIVYYVVDVVANSATVLKSAFANNTYGKNITQTTSDMAVANHAILAINGDYYGFRESGLIIRNGILYRDEARSAPDNISLLVGLDGGFTLVDENSVNGAQLISEGIQQSFSFGPVLVKDGVIQSCTTSFVSSKANPRTAIGMITPLHYLIVVVDGRSSVSAGMTLKQLAQVFADKGALIAYNLDGGGSSTLWFNGQIINNPTDGRSDSERKVSDILYFGA